MNVLICIECLLMFRMVLILSLCLFGSLMISVGGVLFGWGCWEYFSWLILSVFWIICCMVGKEEVMCLFCDVVFSGGVCLLLLGLILFCCFGVGVWCCIC